MQNDLTNSLPPNSYILGKTFLRQGLTLYCRLAQNSVMLPRLALNSQLSSCLSFISTGMEYFLSTSLSQHVWINSSLIPIKLSIIRVKKLEIQEHCQLQFELILKDSQLSFHRRWASSYTADQQEKSQIRHFY